MRNQALIVAILWGAVLSPIAPAEADSGTLILTGNNSVSREAVRTFTTLVGETEPKIVVIVDAQSKGISDHGTASSSGSVLPCQMCSAQTGRSPTTAQCAQALRHMKPFRLRTFTLLAAADASIGSDQAALTALREASGVWLTGANSMEFVRALRNTPAGQELTVLLERGGVIGADSGAAMAVGSLVIPESEIKDPAGKIPEEDIQGLNLLDNTVIDREMAKESPSGQLSNVVRGRPGVIGISLGDSGTVVIHAGVLRVASTDPILISDGEDHHGKTYYRLSPRRTPEH